MSAWLERLRAIGFRADTPVLLSPKSPQHPPQAPLGDLGDKSTGISPKNEPAIDAPGYVWTAWFDSQIRLINEDLAAEGTTLDQVLASMRPKQRRRSQEEVRAARWCRAYLAELTPRLGTPCTPCACGDVVFYQLVGDCRWRCRSCERASPRARARWFALNRRLAEPNLQSRHKLLLLVSPRGQLSDSCADSVNLGHPALGGCERCAKSDEQVKLDGVPCFVI
jgi:hypothetical protein